MSAARWWLVVAVALVGCGGGDEAPAAGTPAAGLPPPAAEAAQPQDSVAPTTPQRPSGIELAREVFSYRGSGRDPFRSLITSGEVRPLFDDLRLTAVVYDARYPARSVAVLRDVAVNKRYDVRVDDQLGRLRVVEVRQNAVVFVLEEFGVERQVTLALRRTQEGIP